MKLKTRTILAINPGTRYVAIAVIKDDRLVDWGVSAVLADSPQATLQKTRLLITRYLEEYEPNTIVLKSIKPTLSPDLLIRQLRDIQTITLEYGLLVHQFSIQEIESYLVPDKPINKRRLAEVIVKRHPALIHVLQKEQEALNPYHTRVFEAVALAEVVYRSMCVSRTKPTTHFN